MSTPALETAPRGDAPRRVGPPQDANTNDPDQAAADARTPEARVQEVLENGGFLACNDQRTRKAAREGVDLYEYQRMSRDGRPLAGAEARRPPIYRLTAWGALGLTCSCPRSRRSKETCKHQEALTRSLLGRVGGQS